MHRSRRFASALAVVALLLAAATGAVAAGAPADGTYALQDDGNESDNETARHQDPDEYSEDGDMDELEGWLSGWMNDQLADGAIELEQGEYDAASEYVDEEYYERLDQYVDVAGETGGESSEESFEEAANEQAEMTDSAREYEETREEYEEARDAGDEQRARELARELEAIAGDVEESSEGVRSRYEELENETGADLGEADEAIESANDDIQESQAEIREAEFEETRLELTVEEPAEISFVEPLEVEGEVRTAEGEPISDEELAFEIGNQTVRTESDGEGGFEFTYRPTTLALSTEDLEVAYRPENASAYLGTSENVSVAVEQVEPTVTGLSVPERTAYGEEVTVAGEFAVGDTPIENVALAVVADGQRIGAVGVEDGEFEGSVELPIGVASGEVELGVAFPYEGRALAPVSATGTVTVEETPTGLSVSASRSGEDALSIDGSLSSDADAVGERTIDLAVDGSTVGTATTDGNGDFTQRVEIPESADGNLTVRASYDGSGTSLAPAEATTRLASGGGGGTLSWLPGWLRWAGVALAGLLVVGAVLGARRYRRSEGSPVAGGTAGAAASAEESDPERRRRETAARLALSRAAAELEDDPEAAMEHCYGAVRHELAARVGGDRSMTHWEFYRQYSGAHDDLLRDATESYERAVFGRGGIPADEVSGLLKRARDLSGIEGGTAD